MNNPGPTPEPHHVPVLAHEVLEFLAPQPGQVLVDATAGAGGHTLLLAQAVAPEGRILALDQDAAMLALARRRLAGLPVTLVQANFAYLREVLQEQGVPPVDAVLADLGICSAQLDDPQRGFSFQQSGPLDMRMNPEEGEPARNLLRRLSERDLADIFWQYGEERFSRRIARRLVEERQRTPLETTEQLADLVRRCVPRARPTGKRSHRPTIDPATRVFQALRIAVNKELAALDRLLETLPDCLREGGRAAIISFHSLEDRRVKQAFRDRRQWEELVRKPIQASAAEATSNPRARSAKLRVARKVSHNATERTVSGGRH
jgi:16S rRNA (cytosine1402-N4)-methyltransferase